MTKKVETEGERLISIMLFGDMYEPKNQDFLLLIVGNMEKYGGNFVKALAKCYLVADPINRFKILGAFTNYFEEYLPDKWA